MKIKFFIIIIFAFNLNLYSMVQISGSYFSRLGIDELKKEIDKIQGESDAFIKNARLGFIYHFLSEKGEHTSQNSIDCFNKALELDSDNYILKAYLGSAYTLLANEREEKPAKIKFANQGIQLLDKVYNDNSSDYEVDILYISNSIALPNNLFSRLNNAVTAVDKLISNIKNYNDDQKAEIFYLKALTLFQSGKEPDAIKLWKAVVKDYPNTDSAGLARQNSKKYSE
jgi:tetratricopeptide (TPR) repeat protein